MTQKKFSKAGVVTLLALALLTLLAYIVMPRYGSSRDAKITSAMTQIGSFKMALDAYKADNGTYPKSGNLDALINAPANLQTWKGPYLDAIPMDPWGNAYTYVYPGKHNPDSFDLSSAGPSGQSGTGDSVTNWDAKKL